MAAGPDDDTLDFDFEPTDDFLASALNTGIADGTIVISDDDFVPDEDLEEDDTTSEYSPPPLSLVLTQSAKVT